MADVAPTAATSFPPKRGRGRPKHEHVDHATIAGLSHEDMVDRLAEAIAGNVESLRLKAKTGRLTAGEVMAAGRLARTLETCSRAKKTLVDIGKDGDLSGIPTEQLAAVVVRAMRTNPDLKAAIAAELKKKGPSA